MKPIGHITRNSTTSIVALWGLRSKIGLDLSVNVTSMFLKVKSMRSRIESIHEQPLMFRPLDRNLQPGGYAEFIDLDIEWTSPDGSLTEDHASLKFNQEFRKAARAANAEPSPGPLLEGHLKDAGFEDVVAQKYVWPVGTWAAERHLVSRIRHFSSPSRIHSSCIPTCIILTSLTSLNSPCRKKWALGTTCK